MNLSKYGSISILSCALLVISSPITQQSSFNTFSSEYLFGTPTRDSNETIWDRLNSDFSLDHKAQSPEVKTAIRQLLADKKKLYEILESSEPYIYYIYQQTRSKGLPAEVALIPAIESEFNPNDHSNKGATGLWQLMPGTAHELGVKVKSNYDGRRNVVASTHAALAYLKDLGDHYKENWYLAIAAYNCGEARVESALRKAGSRNFWNLKKLPRETRDYIPKLLAVAAIIENPKKYGIELPNIENNPYFSEVKLKKSISLNKIAATTGMSMDSLYELNPDFKKHGMVANNNFYTLLVPVEYITTMENEFPSIISKMA